MSRSRKKTWGYTDNSDSHHSKKLASRAFRRAVKRGEDVQGGNWYRKWTESWDIHDFKFLYFRRHGHQRRFWYPDNVMDEHRPYRMWMK